MKTPRIRTIAVALLTSGLFAISAAPGRCEVVRIQVDRQQVFAGGHSFGPAGPYESLSGRLSFEVNPEHQANLGITDLRRAPRNVKGNVEFWADYSVRAVLTTGLPSNRESAAADRRILHASIKTTNTVAKELRIASWHWRQL